MKKISLAGKIVEIYDAIEELPILRFHKYNKMLLVDAGIGSDLSDVDRHITKAAIYAKENNPAMAAKELENLRQNVFFIQNNISPRYLSFAVLVKSINGKPYNDLTDEGLKKIVDLFADVPNDVLTAQLDAVKKKIDEELRLYFPRLFDDSTMKEYFDKLKRRTLLVLKTIISGNADEETQKEVESITDDLITYFNPQSFGGSDNTEIRYDRQFENMCLVLSRNLNVNAKEYTVLEYYNAFEYLKEENKKARKAKNAK